MTEKKLICIGCPMGCLLTVEAEGTECVSVKGNTCKHGAEYAQKEIKSPSRALTTTVRAKGPKLRMLPVKTKTDIPKDKIFACVRELKTVEVKPPVRIGEVVLANVAGTGVDVVATKDIF